jgi:hypothetical protein
MTRVRLCLPPTSLVKVPEIYHFDVYNNLIIMEDCGTDVVTLREFLCSDGASAADLAQTIGTAVGEFIAFVHEWSRSNPDNIIDVFDKNLHAKRMIADLSYDRLVTTLQRTDKDDLPLLSGLEVDPSDIRAISKLTDEYRSHLMSPRVPGHDVVSVPFHLKKKKVVSVSTSSYFFFLNDHVDRSNVGLVSHGRSLARKHHRQCQPAASHSSLYIGLGTRTARTAGVGHWPVLRVHGYTRSRESGRLGSGVGDASLLPRRLLPCFEAGCPSCPGYFGALGYYIHFLGAS